MNATNLPAASGAEGEQLIGALVPATPPGRPPPIPAPLPALPPLRLPSGTGPDALLLDMARLDRSGRVYARALLDALGWRPGHRVDIAAVAGVLVIGSAATGVHAVGSRGGLSLPAAARRMCGLEAGPPVLLVASLPQDVLVVHPASAVARLIAGYYGRIEGARDDR